MVLVVAEIMFLPTAWPVISGFTKFTAIIAVVCPYVFLYLACAVDPGYVTEETLDHHMAMYPYDFALFHPGRICKTCNLPKPPRSKHCSVCKRCVARSDHHCIFINGCVGYRNHHWFLLLLLSTAILTAYGGMLGLSIIKTEICWYEPSWGLWPPKSMTYVRWLTILGMGLRTKVGLGAATLLSGMISPLVWGLLFYSLYLVYCGTTTNESLKWSEWKEDIQDGYAFGRTLPADRVVRSEPPWTRWPAQPERILVTTSDGNPPRPEQRIPGTGEWERLKSLKYVDNIYDLGFWDNMKDIFILDYPFGSEAGEPLSERSGYERATRIKEK